MWSPDEMAEMLTEFKPRFIHHPSSLAHVHAIVTALGADPEVTHVEVPKLRTSFPVGHLTTGIAKAFQVHRDTWYAAPPMQINWWLPIYEVDETNAMEFFPKRWGTQVPNNSGDLNYYEFNSFRGRIRDFNSSDTRPHPAPLEPLPADEEHLVVLPPVGGVVVFAADQLHASIVNTSGVGRFSIDFRVVNAIDARDGVGAPLPDSRCLGTAMRDFRSVASGAGIADEVVQRYDTPGAIDAGVAVFDWPKQ